MGGTVATEQQLSLDLSLVNPAAAVRALRDAHYDNTAKAIAELIDNSIDANATQVELLIEEDRQLVTTRRRWRVHRIAVNDNGSGMDEQTLVEALRVGGRLGAQAVTAIGKYGMGLPTASASQCMLAEVWTWQESIERPLHSRLDVGGIIAGRVMEQPWPDTAPIPAEWRSRISESGLDARSGTLIVWSDFGDRVLGAAQTLFRQVEEEIGRTYRHFINDRDVTIRMARFRGPSLERETEIRPNDPLFLMPGSATPAPWHELPMFQPYGKPKKYFFQVDEQGADGEIQTSEHAAEVVYSMVRPEVILENKDKDGEPRAGMPGNLDHGRLAGRNIGVSIVRANRELLLDPNFLPTGGGQRENRWWGCEIRFEPGLDDLFGVDQNKQMATRISNAARALVNVGAGTTTDTDALKALDIEQGDPAYPLYEMVNEIRRTTRNIRVEVEQLFKKRLEQQRRAGRNGGPPSAEAEALSVAREATAEALREGATPTQTDLERDRSDAGARETALAEHLAEGGEDSDTAHVHARSIVERDDWYAFTQRRLYGHQMFGVDSVKGTLVVALNINHELSEFLDVLEQQSDKLEDPLARRGAVALRTLLLAWARLQDETAEGRDRAHLEDVAMQWGSACSSLPPGGRGGATPERRRIVAIRPWDALQSLALGAEQVLIAAPYIKEGALRSLLDLTPGGAAVTCVTRWQRNDIAAGASDVACRTLVVSRGGSFLLHQRLHAKYYRFDGGILVGSANLSASGMGYQSPAALEILCAPGAAFDPAAFERDLLTRAREVSDAEFEQWRAIERLPMTKEGSAGGAVMDEWTPHTREPSHVWLVYRGQSMAVVSADERARARRDIDALQPPRDLERDEFDAFMTGALLSSAAVADVLRVDGLPDQAAWTDLANTWGTTRSIAQRTRETAWNWIATFLDRPPRSAPQSPQTDVSGPE